MSPADCCLQCPHAVRTGIWTCGKSGRALNDHWAAGDCPVECFGLGQANEPATGERDIPVEMLTPDERALLGDLLKEKIHALKLDVVANRLRGLPDDHECSGCEMRRKLLNRLDEWWRGRK